MVSKTNEITTHNSKNVLRCDPPMVFFKKWVQKLWGDLEYKHRFAMLALIIPAMRVSGCCQAFGMLFKHLAKTSLLYKDLQ